MTCYKCKLIHDKDLSSSVFMQIWIFLFFISHSKRQFYVINMYRPREVFIDKMFEWIFMTSQFVAQFLKEVICSVFGEWFGGYYIYREYARWHHINTVDLENHKLWDKLRSVLNNNRGNGMNLVLIFR